MILASDTETALDNNDVITCERRFGIPADDCRLPGDVATARCALEEDFVIVPVWMDQRSAWSECIGHGEHGGQSLEFDFDRASSRLRLFATGGGTRGTLLTMKPNPARREHRMVGDADTVHSRRILGKGDRAHARHLSGA